MNKPSLMVLAITMFLAGPLWADTGADIDAVSRQIEQLNADIKEANRNKNKELANQLRDQRSEAKTRLRDLKARLREEKKEADQLARRKAAEAEWETYPPGKKLCTAIQYNRFDLVRKVVDSGAVDFTKPLENCGFPLGEAVAGGSLEMTEYLLGKGAPKTTRAPIMNMLISAMDMAANHPEDRTEILTLLKRHGATHLDSVEADMAGAIVHHGDQDGSARAKLKQDYNLETDMLTTGTSFTRAIEKGHINNLRWLLQNGASPEESMSGRTALMIAVDSTDPDKVKLLVETCADVNRRGLNFQSVLAYAEKRQTRAGGKKKERLNAIVSYLKQKGATRSEQDQSEQVKAGP